MEETLKKYLQPTSHHLELAYTPVREPVIGKGSGIIPGQSDLP